MDKKDESVKGDIKTVSIQHKTNPQVISEMINTWSHTSYCNYKASTASIKGKVAL